MPTILNVISGMILGYLIGAVPSGYIFGKAYKGIDIREHGSGNLGATNVLRVLGKVPGIIVLVLDILKGVLAIVAVAALLGLTTPLAYICLGVSAVIGHNWTCFLRFKGGKGIATTLGVLIGLTIQIAAIRPVLFGAVLVWLVVFLFSGYVSLGSIIAAIALPILMVLTAQTLEITILGVIFCLFVVIRHKDNIRRLLAGEESRFNTPFCKKK